jgi:L,D-transpeptidase ErfK/SrfK
MRSMQPSPHCESVEGVKPVSMCENCVRPARLDFCADPRATPLREHCPLKRIRDVRALAFSLTLLPAACVSEVDEAPRTDTARAVAIDSAPGVTRVDSTSTTMRIEVDVGARQLHVVDGGTRVASHPVAVGSEQWPTATGEWTIKQVVFNPEWIPPDESWAEEREPRKSGDPKNPLGRVQLVYDAPRSIHGTNNPTSIGKAVSHGSIRVTNAVGVQLARQILEAGGAAKDDAWLDRVRANRSEKQVIDLPRPVPIRVF